MAQTTTRSRSTTKGSTSRAQNEKKGRQRERQSSHEHHAAAVQAQSRSRPKSRSTGQSLNGAKSFKDSVVNGTKEAEDGQSPMRRRRPRSPDRRRHSDRGAAAGVVLKDRLGAGQVQESPESPGRHVDAQVSSEARPRHQ